MSVPDVETAADAFGVLSDPTRVELLVHLWLEGRQEPVSFSTLQARAGVEDSGRFNYHLQQLTDHFVAETAAGYRLQPAGLAVVDTLYSGVVTPAVTLTERYGADCPDCGTAVRLAYEDGYMHVTCPGCDRQFTRFIFPPRAVRDRESPADIARAFGTYARSLIDRAVDGLCPYCGGRMAVDGLATETDMRFELTCGGCRGRVRASPWAVAAVSPPVVGFLHEHAVDARAPLWEQSWVGAATARVAARDPPAVDLTVPAGDERLAVRIGIEAGRLVVRRDPEPEA